ncbi:hypothetical protein [Streptomyces sp. NPDC048560]|uniref:hypothetical protein n=1 Tax=Streptomyces sp. NPDC048560 TaxID=3155488 RepID=UPI0034154BD2
MSFTEKPLKALVFLNMDVLPSGVTSKCSVPGHTICADALSVRREETSGWSTRITLLGGHSPPPDRPPPEGQDPPGRRSTLSPHKLYLAERWAEGRDNAQRLCDAFTWIVGHAENQDEQARQNLLSSRV